MRDCWTRWRASCTWEASIEITLDMLVARLGLEVVPVDREQAVLARDGFRRFGKGRDRAGLNYGDCFAYALAIATGETLLFKGNDFGRTDVRVA